MKRIACKLSATAGLLTLLCSQTFSAFAASNPKTNTNTINPLFLIIPAVAVLAAAVALIIGKKKK